MRGALLRELTAHPGQDEAALSKATGFDLARIAAALPGLIAEGFVAEEGGRFRIA